MINLTTLIDGLHVDGPGRLQTVFGTCNALTDLRDAWKTRACSPQAACLHSRFLMHGRPSVVDISGSIPLAVYARSVLFPLYHFSYKLPIVLPS
jgi:hypothetical protein